MRSVWGVPWRCFSRLVPKSRPPTWWQQGWARQRAGSVAEAELLAPLGELLMPGMPLQEMFRSFKSPAGWGGHYLEPDLTTYGFKTAALFVEYDGYYRHATKEGMDRDQIKNTALLAFAPPGSYVVRINHENKCELEENVLWVGVNAWRRGDQKSLSMTLRKVIEQATSRLEHAFDSGRRQELLGQIENETILISKAALNFRDAAVLIGPGNTAEEIHDFLNAEGFQPRDISRMQTKALSGISIHRSLQPKLQWLMDLGLTRSQLVKAVIRFPSVLGLSVKQNLNPTVQWFLDFGLTQRQIAKAVSIHPQILGLGIKQNLKPTVQWFLDLGLTKSQVAKAVAIHPQILSYSIQQNLKPTARWLLDLGLTKGQIAKASASYPQILSLSIEHNLKAKVEWLLDLGLMKSRVTKAVARFPPILWNSIEHNLKPTAQWLLDLGLTKSQVAKVVGTSPAILGLSIEQNLRPTVQWFLDLGLTKKQVAKAVATHPHILSYSIQQNLKPTALWLLDLGLTQGQIAKVVATFPQILGLSIEQNLKPTVQWFLDLGLKQNQIAKAMITFPPIFGLSLDKLTCKVKLLQSFYTPSITVELIALWPVILGYSQQRLKKRLNVLAEQESLAKLRCAMTLTEEVFQQRFLAGAEMCPCKRSA